MNPIKVHTTISVNGIDCIPGKLILIELSKEQKDKAFQESEVVIFSDNKTFKPIIISETEKMGINEEGWGYNIETKQLLFCDLNYYNPWTYKVLALTEKFSSEQLQMIASCPPGKMFGEEVFVECEKISPSDKYIRTEDYFDSSFFLFSN